MKTNKVMIIVCILVAILTLTGCQTGGAASPSAEPDAGSGYRQAVFEKTTDQGAVFLACGTGGRLDRIYEDSTVENISLPVGDADLTSVLAAGEITIVAGASGAIAYSHDGKTFESAEGAGEEHITGLAQYNGKYFASTYSGKLLTSDDGAVWETAEQLTTEPLIGIVANDSYIVATTGQTDIFRSADGNNWESWNYNKLYEGLAADVYSFTNLTSSGGFFYFIGHASDSGSNWFTVMFSEGAGEGDIFSFAGVRKINDRGAEAFAPLSVYSIQLFGDSLLAACSGGRLLTIDPCEDCCLMMDVSDSDADMRCVALSDGNEIIFTGGDNFEFSVFPKEEFVDSAQ